MSLATLAPVTDGPLNETHHHELAMANARAKKVRSAAKVAAFNGWVTALFAACSAPFAFFSISGFLVAAGLTLVAYNEFRGRRGLRSFDPAAPRLLGWNQLGFLALIIAYCFWMIIQGLAGPGVFAAELEAKPELAEALGSMEGLDELYRILVVGMYGGIIVLSAVFQGLNALYYFTRRKHVEQYVRETPAWVLDVQRSAST